MRRQWFQVVLLLVVVMVEIVHMDSVNSPQVIQVRSHERYRGFSQTTQTQRSISIEGDNFIVDGKTLHILSGSIHYFRLPAETWRDRLRKLKAVGLNAVSTYVEWSFHEPEERQYNFEGDRDIASFIRIAAEEGLYVLLRPGPYICAERDLGGLPYWLLRKDIRLRSTDERFVHETKVWMNKLFSYMTPLLYQNGGPIILVQVENEYGSYGSDKRYMEQMRDIILEHVGTNALLYTTDGPYASYFTNGAVEGTLTTIDFGTGQNISSIFSDLRKYMPGGPLMNSEFYPGWLTHWGESLQQVATSAVIDSLRDMMDLQINFNIYVFFGGTNFEFSAGANSGGTYLPDITSYDYDAPLNEAGDPTEKYYAIRTLLEKYNPSLKNVPIPVPSPKGAYGPVSVSPKINLLSADGRYKLGRRSVDVSGTVLPSFEHLNQRAGMVLYETVINEENAILRINKPRDNIYVFVNNNYQGKLSRNEKKLWLSLQAKVNSTLSLLVDSQGRLNFGPYLHDYKGINGTVKYDVHTLNGPWYITGYPLEKLEYEHDCHPKDDEAKVPMIFDGFFTLPIDETPLDTFLNPTGWGKGYIWINGRNLGRYWPGKGPQVTLYVPGVWLLPAPEQNHIQILELESISANLNMEFIDYPILNGSNSIL